ncbi:sensor protein [Cystobacter fuscus]|uniref:histidine kinase n=1 Tax=Cystobacter fuscus TaxID=43 RepID=A0A250J8M5_9BACT|nr:response regulator [Cystobacter fuscus]ATB40244.1 sensor protein [Cystobacter fuscus]
MMLPIEVLLVEDNPADADLTREALAESKLLVNLEVVDDGEKAESYLLRLPPYEKAVHPHLVLLDLNLPRRNGREVLRTIRSTPTLKHIPVVVLSSSNTEMDVLKTYGLGANCYVVKPVRFTDFFEIVRIVGEFWFTVVRLPPPELCTGEPSTPSPLPKLPATPMETPLQVLLVEDNPGDADLVREYLEPHPAWTLSVRGTLREALEFAAAQRVDVVLLDLGLPDCQGLNSLEQMVEQLPTTPIVVLTGHEGSTLGRVMVRAGAQDYLEKDRLDGNLLTRSIAYSVERAWASRERDALLARANVARERAEDAVLLRDEFLSVASHELKTPLTTLLLQQQMVERALAQGGRAPDRDSLQQRTLAMHKQCERLSRLVDSLLDVSRLSTGRMMLERSRVELTQLARECIERLSPQVEASGGTVSLEAPTPVEGNWDRFRLEQVVVNLLTNALKYGEGKPVELIVRREGESAVLVVRDHGMGIREEDQRRIFDRFERAAPARHFGGVGLGLYITRQIVNAHAGTIEVTSKPGEGSTFKVRLPLRTQA